MSNSSKAVKAANKASSSRLAALVSTEYDLGTLLYITPNGRQLRLQVCHARDLKKRQRDAIWDIFEANMRAMYEASTTFDWDPEEKKKELFHSLSRFILVTPATDPACLLAFLNFRFEVEEEEDVLYCYDLQIALNGRRMGLGKKLLQELDKLGVVFQMEKIMLTVFKANTNAKAFYNAVGFSLDPTMTEEDFEEVDYEILSREIPAPGADEGGELTSS